VSTANISQIPRLPRFPAADLHRRTRLRNARRPIPPDDAPFRINLHHTYRLVPRRRTDQGRWNTHHGVGGCSESGRGIHDSDSAPESQCSVLPILDNGGRSVLGATHANDPIPNIHTPTHTRTNTPFPDPLLVRLTADPKLRRNGLRNRFRRRNCQSLGYPRWIRDTCLPRTRRRRQRIRMAVLASWSIRIDRDTYDRLCKRPEIRGRTRDAVDYWIRRHSGQNI
jgi:hypothetical protein